MEKLTEHIENVHNNKTNNNNNSVTIDHSLKQQQSLTTNWINKQKLTQMFDPIKNAPPLSAVTLFYTNYKKLRFM